MKNYSLVRVLGICAALGGCTIAENSEKLFTSEKQRTYSIGFVSYLSKYYELAMSSTNFNSLQVVFPGWEPLDVFGPMELLYSVSSSP